MHNSKQQHTAHTAQTQVQASEWDPTLVTAWVVLEGGREPEGEEGERGRGRRETQKEKGGRNRATDIVTDCLCSGKCAL
jgi:hypothetical protein